MLWGLIRALWERFQSQSQSQVQGFGAVSIVEVAGGCGLRERQENYNGTVGFFWWVATVPVVGFRAGRGCSHRALAALGFGFLR